MKISRFVSVVALAAFGAGACSETAAPAGPTAPATPSPARIVGALISGTTTLFQRGQTQQFRAMATLSTGFTEDRTASATWQSDNAGVAAVSSTGIVTAGNEGSATISATVEGQRGTYNVTVKYQNRTADPAPGQQLPLPSYVEALIRQFSAERPDLMAQSCPRGIKYVNNPWQDYMIDRFRTVDTRWGYNAKPTRTAADNGGVAVVAAGDELAYNYSASPDEGSTSVYLIDMLGNHCGPTPGITYRHFTGEEPGRWTGAGRF